MSQSKTVAFFMKALSIGGAKQMMVAMARETLELFRRYVRCVAAP